MKIGDEVFVHGYVDEIRQGVVIIRNEGGYFGTVEEEICAAPTTEQSSMVGEWVDRTAEHKERGDIIDIRECSVCHACYFRSYAASLGFDEEIPNYCPNCGAKMKGAE